MNLKDTLERNISKHSFTPVDYKHHMQYYFYADNMTNIHLWWKVRDNLKDNIDSIIEFHVKEFIYFRISSANSITIKTSILNSFK